MEPRARSPAASSATIAWISPLWHGVDLARGAALGHLTAARTAGHLAYLSAWLVVGLLVARHRFAVRLQK